MTKWDNEYIKLCKTILNEGVHLEDRTGVDTIKIPAYSFCLDVGEEFPVLTTKQLYFKKAISEILWIWQAQSNELSWLHERDNHIWDEWAVDSEGNWNATQTLLNPETKKLERKAIKKYIGKEYAGTIGTAYGYVVRKYHLTEKVLEIIKYNHINRKNVASLWQETDMPTAVLEPCCWSTEWDVTEGKLNCWLHIRSSDVPLGLPFNITQYAVLLSLFAHCSDLKPGKLYVSIKAAHIYVNQIDGIKEQIKRFEEQDDIKAPTLWINPEVKDFFKLDNSIELKDIKVIGYNHMGPIKFPISQ